MSDSVTPWTVAHQAPPSKEFSRQEYWHGLPFPTHRSVGKESACNAGDLGSIPGLRRFPGEGKGYPLQCSGLENSKDCIVPGVAKSQTQLSNFQFHFLMGLMQFKEYVKWS